MSNGEIVKDQPTYGIIGACAYLHVSETSLNDLVDSGELAASKPSRELVFRKSVLDEYLARLEQQQTEQRREAYINGVKPIIKTAVSVIRSKRREIPELPGFRQAA